MGLFMRGWLGMLGVMRVDFGGMEMNCKGRGEVL